ncbi:hypothetical protein STH12_01716 [Shewanella khirikhana]|uniref:Uncharacterized protein n=1 Tax=Shewanella khirikhana TaxID=1965282 RepID=A0ABM7DNJ9_9GAMM|nr:hypothetical protein STH12_01716 [Shewanella khirikhana]
MILLIFNHHQLQTWLSCHWSRTIIAILTPNCGRNMNFRELNVGFDSIFTKHLFTSQNKLNADFLMNDVR